MNKLVSYFTETQNLSFADGPIFYADGTVVIEEAYLNNSLFIISIMRSFYEVVYPFLSTQRKERLPQLCLRNLTRLLKYAWGQGSYVNNLMVLIVKWSKYHFTVPLARLCAAKNPETFLPPKPTGWNPYDQRFNNLIFLLTKRGDRSYQIAWSLFQGVKRGCSKVPESFVEDALESHKKNLCDLEPLPYEQD